MRNVINVSVNQSDVVEQIRKETEHLKRLHVISIGGCKKKYDNGVYYCNFRGLLDLIERAERGVEMVVVIEDFAGILGDEGLHDVISDILSMKNVKSYINLTSDYGAMEAYKMIDRDKKPARVEVRYFHKGEYITMNL